MQPLISVIIPVYNGEKYLEEAIESLLNQKYEPLEIIVIDDGSTDTTATIAKSYGTALRYFYQENAGPARALNFGISEANGVFLGFIDADDLWVKQKIKRLLTPMLENPKISAVVGELQRFWIDQHQTRHFLEKERASSLLAGLFKRELFESVGKLNEQLYAHYDIDWYLRLNEKDYPVKYIPDVVGYYRRHGENASSTSDATENNKAMLALLHQSILRRRKAK